MSLITARRMLPEQSPFNFEEHRAQCSLVCCFFNTYMAATFKRDFYNYLSYNIDTETFLRFVILMTNTTR